MSNKKDERNMHFPDGLISFFTGRTNEINESTPLGPLAARRQALSGFQQEYNALETRVNECAKLVERGGSPALAMEKITTSSAALSSLNGKIQRFASEIDERLEDVETLLGKIKRLATQLQALQPTHNG